MSGFERDPVGKWCVTCERVTLRSDAEGLVCDGCLADTVEAREPGRCGACGSITGRGDGLCADCFARDHETRVGYEHAAGFPGGPF